jgi:hypothetical protein
MIGKRYRQPVKRARDPIGEECEAVMRAADALDIKEFDFFRLAYRRWFGTQPLPQYLEQSFAAYMLGRAVPVWVRQLAREVLEGEAGPRADGLRSGAAWRERPVPRSRRRGAPPLPSDAFGSAAYRDRPGRHPYGRLYVGGVFVLWLALLSALLGSDPQPQAGPAACGGPQALPAVAAVVHALSGERPVCTQVASGDEQAR